MYDGKVSIVAAFVLALVAVQCNRDVRESRDSNVGEERSDSANRAAELQRERNDEITRLSERVTEIEREYGEANQKVVSGNRTATAGLRQELKEDVANIKQAVDDLRSTTPENWWDVTKTRVTEYVDRVEQSVDRLDDNKG